VPEEVLRTIPGRGGREEEVRVEYGGEAKERLLQQESGEEAEAH